MSELPQTDAARSGVERRLVERVLRHWTKVAAGQRVPRLNESDPWVVGDDWANCVVIAVQSPVELSYFVAAGKNLAVALCTRDTLAGLLLSHLPSVLSARRGLIVEGEATLRGVPILYRAALLPLSEDGVAIDHVLGAANHRTLHPDEPTTKTSCQEALDLDPRFLCEPNLRSFCELVPVAASPSVIGVPGADFVGERSG